MPSVKRMIIRLQVRQDRNNYKNNQMNKTRGENVYLIFILFKTKIEIKIFFYSGGGQGTLEEHVTMPSEYCLFHCLVLLVVQRLFNKKMSYNV
jgi:hypothetical protein